MVEIPINMAKYWIPVRVDWKHYDVKCYPDNSAAGGNFVKKIVVKIRRSIRQYHFFHMTQFGLILFLSIKKDGCFVC